MILNPSSPPAFKRKPPHGSFLFFLTAVFVVFSCFWPAPLPASDFYKWVDENGVTHFSQTPPPDEKNYASERLNNTSAKPQFERDPTQKVIPWPKSTKKKEQKKKKKKGKIEKVEEKITVSEPVKLYTTRWCGYCKQAKAYLNKLGVRYIEYDVENDPIASTRKNRLAPRSGVPVAVINGRVVRGFNPKAYLAALKRPPD